MSEPTAPAGRSMAARLAGPAVVLAIACFCAVMWALLIRAHLPGPAPAGPPFDYSDLLAPGQQERSERWGIYLGPQRVGGAEMHVTRETDGTISLMTQVRANLGPAAKYIAGFVGVLEVEFHAIISPLRGLLSWRLGSDALDANMLGVVRGDRMLIKGRLRGRPMDSEAPFEPGALVSQAFSPVTAMPSLEDAQVGQGWSVSVLNPVTGDLQDVTVRIARSLEVAIDGGRVRAFELAFQAPTGEWTCWVTEDGQVLVQGTPFGLTLRREDLPAEVLHALTDAPAQPGNAAR